MYILKSYLLTFLFLISISAEAKFKNIGSIEVVLTSKQSAEVKLTDKFDVELPTSLYLGTLEKNCEVTAVQKVGPTLLIKTDQCPEPVKIGMTIYFNDSSFTNKEEPSAAIMPIAQNQPAAQPLSSPNEVSMNEADYLEKTSFINIGLGVRINNKLKFDSASATNGASYASGKLEYESGSPTLLEISFMQVSQNSWGWSAGLTSFKNEWSSFNDGVTSYSTIASTNVLAINFNAVFRTDKVFFPLGFNISSLSSSNSPFLSANTGGVGAQIGVGFLLQKHFSLLLESKVITYSGGSVTSGTTTLSANAGYGSGLNLVALITF